MTFAQDSFSAAVYKKRCEERRRSLRQAAKETGVSISTLSRIETGGMPDLVNYAKLCRWMGYPLDHFFTPYKPS